MLITSRISQALEDNREAFRQAAERSSEACARYLRAWDELCQLTSGEIEEHLGGVAWPGARPTPELDKRGCIVPFGTHWDTAQEARAWALDRLHGTQTVGVDGSQIAASKEFGVPIALVQVAWFANPHDGDRPYTKDLRNEVIAPDEPPEDVTEFAFAESRVNRRRYELEMDVAAQCLQKPAGPDSLVLHDGSFVLSFAGRMPPETREAYLQALFRVLDSSCDRRAPIAGYVDLSLATDLVTMLQTALDLSGGNLFDAQLLVNRLDTFDRTAAFRCARGDILPQYKRGDRDYSDEICFVYLKTGKGRLPARIDFPRWVLDDDLLDRVVDLIRAEVVIGSGYPYALETADAAAVLTTEDRLTFYRLWHEFATHAGLSPGMPAKSLSKIRRR